MTFHEALTAWSTAAAAAVVLIGAVVALWQLRELKRARQVDAFFRVFDELGRAEIFTTRHELLTTKPFPRAEDLSDEEFTQAWARWRPLGTAFNRIGLLVDFLLVPKRIVLDFYRQGIIDTFDRLEPYLRRERSRRQLDTYLFHFDSLYRMACRYHRRPYPKEPTHRFRQV